MLSPSFIPIFCPLFRFCFFQCFSDSFPNPRQQLVIKCLNFAIPDQWEKAWRTWWPMLWIWAIYICSFHYESQKEAYRLIKTALLSVVGWSIIHQEGERDNFQVSFLLCDLQHGDLAFLWVTINSMSGARKIRQQLLAISSYLDLIGQTLHLMIF